MEANAEGLDALTRELLKLYRRALSAERMDVAEHLLRALEQLATTGSSRTALEAAYLDLASHAARSRAAK